MKFYSKILLAWGPADEDPLADEGVDPHPLPALDSEVGIEHAPNNNNNLKEEMVGWGHWALPADDGPQPMQEEQPNADIQGAQNVGVMEDQPVDSGLTAASAESDDDGSVNDIRIANVIEEVEQDPPQLPNAADDHLLVINNAPDALLPDVVINNDHDVLKPDAVIPEAHNENINQAQEEEVNQNVQMGPIE